MASGREPFPRALTCALLVPLGLYALAYMGVRGYAIPLILGAATFAELLAVPVAIFLLLRHGRYRGIGNIAVTLVAAVPLALSLALVFTVLFGHYHM